MTIERTLTVPLEINIHRNSIFLIAAGGTYTVSNGEQFNLGFAGDSLVAYLPGHEAVSINVRQIIMAGLEAQGYCPYCGPGPHSDPACPTVTTAADDLAAEASAAEHDAMTPEQRDAIPTSDAF